MNSEEVYQATKKVFAAYAGFFHEVAKEIGLERALALHQAAQERIGLAAARVLWSPGQQHVDLDCLQSTLLASNRSIGIESEAADSARAGSSPAAPRCPARRAGGRSGRPARPSSSRRTWGSESSGGPRRWRSFPSEQVGRWLGDAAAEQHPGNLAPAS